MYKKLGEVKTIMSTRHFSPTDTGNIGKPTSKQNGKTLSVNSGQNKLINKNLRNAKFRFIAWLLLFIFSLFPLLIIPFVKILDNVPTHIVFSGFLTNHELFFIGITMAVSAINDFISNTTKHIASYWLFIYILLIILGALIYTAIVVREYYKPEINNENVRTKKE